MKRFLSHNWLIKRLHEEVLAKAAEYYARGKLLDIGCGEKPYKEMLSPYVNEHIGVDTEECIHDKSSIDKFGTAYNIPFDDDSFDTVLCTQVLEHLEEPGDALKEAGRVLKKGGFGIYIQPLFWHLHEEPRDFYRFTKHGLRYLFEKNGFEIVELNAVSGFWVTFGQELVYYIQRFRVGGPINPFWWIIPVFGTIIQSFCYIINKIDKSPAFACHYIVVAQKL